MQYAYGSNHEILVYMEDTANSLRELCKSSGIDVDKLGKPTTPMAPGVARELMANLGPKDVIPPNDVWYRAVHGVIQCAEHGARIDVSFPVRVLGAALGSNTPAPV